MRNWGNSLPDKIVQFLSVDEVLAIHESLVDRFGGVPGWLGAGGYKIPPYDAELE